MLTELFCCLTYKTIFEKNLKTYPWLTTPFCPYDYNFFHNFFLHKIYTCKKWNQLSRYAKKEQDMICKLNQHAITIMLYYYNVPVITYVFPLSSCTPHAADEVAVCIHTWEYLNGVVNPPCENWSMKVQEILVLMHWCKRY